VAREKKRQNGGQVEDVERKMYQEAVDDLGAAQRRRVTEHEVVTKAKNSCVKPIKENQQEVEKRVRMSLTCCRILSAQGLWAL
jgi:hypothetical protein